MEEKITPGEVIDIYKKHGTILTEEEAKLILAFMFEMANIVLNQLMKNES